MTEEEWLSCDDPNPMLRFVRGKVSDRKLRLFAVACCRRIEYLFVSWHQRQSIEIAERYADGFATDAELEAVRNANDVELFARRGIRAEHFVKKAAFSLLLNKLIGQRWKVEMPHMC